MTDAFADINWLAVLAASAAHFMLGAVWFVLLFGRHYAVALGISDQPPRKPGPLFLIGPLLCSAVTIATSALLLHALSIKSYGGGLALGAVVGVGYLAPMAMNIAINPLFPRPFLYALINVPMFVIGSMMACTILVAMA